MAGPKCDSHLYDKQEKLNDIKALLSNGNMYKHYKQTK